MSDTSGEGLMSQGREENQGSAQLPLPSEEKRSPPRTRALPPSALLIFIFFFYPQAPKFATTSQTVVVSPQADLQYFLSPHIPAEGQETLAPQLPTAITALGDGASRSQTE